VGLLIVDLRQPALPGSGAGLHWKPQSIFQVE
jgi:hypothetical protein